MVLMIFIPIGGIHVRNRAIFQSEISVKVVLGFATLRTSSSFVLVSLSNKIMPQCITKICLKINNVNIIE
uniref:Ovule protein n=1 Tax=Heterorhabditis bacteriophora TaxID=37862 RepID=A0A1I7W845_HETBA